MSTEQNIALAREYLETAWNGKDLSVVDRLVAPDHASHGPYTDQLPPGPDGERAFISTFLNAFPDVRATIDSIEGSGDVVHATVTYRGTHTGELMGIPATYKSAVVVVKTTSRIVNGKIVESTAEWDPNEMLHQLGVAAGT